MSISTYATLKSTIADFLLRSDLDAAIPTFIRLAESSIDRDLRHWRQEKRSVAQLDAQYSAIPADYLRPIRLQITDGPTSEVAPLSTPQMLQLRSLRHDRVGRPTHYALTSGSFELYPTPDDVYNASLVYYGRIAALSDSNTANWLLGEAPDAYLYGALIHTAPYLKEDPRVAVWGSLYTTAIDALNKTSEDAKFGGTGLVMRTKRGAP